jgi:hypothetical protein
LCSCIGYDAARSGAQRGVGTAGCLFENAQSRGSLAAERARHTISAGCIAAKRDKYQRAFKRLILSPLTLVRPPRSGPTRTGLTTETAWWSF